MSCLCGNHRNQTIWKHEGILSQDCGGSGRDEAGSSYAVAAARPWDTRRLIRAPLITTPPWFISEALPQLSQRCASCSVVTSPLWTSSLPRCGWQIHAHTRGLIAVSVDVWKCEQIKSRSCPWVPLQDVLVWPFWSWVLSPRIRFESFWFSLSVRDQSCLSGPWLHAGHQSRWKAKRVEQYGNCLMLTLLFVSFF